MKKNISKKSPKKSPISKKKLSKLKEVLDHFEYATYVQTGMKMLNGGFATAEAWNDLSDDIIDIELKWGIQDGEENTVHTENYKLESAKIDNRTAQEICKDIQSA